MMGKGCYRRQGLSVEQWLEDLEKGEHPDSPFGPHLSNSEIVKQLLRAFLKETKTDLLFV